MSLCRAFHSNQAQSGRFQKKKPGSLCLASLQASLTVPPSSKRANLTAQGSGKGWRNDGDKVARTFYRASVARITQRDGVSLPIIGSPQTEPEAPAQSPCPGLLSRWR